MLEGLVVSWCLPEGPKENHGHSWWFPSRGSNLSNTKQKGWHLDAWLLCWYCDECTKYCNLIKSFWILKLGSTLGARKQQTCFTRHVAWREHLSPRQPSLETGAQPSLRWFIENTTHSSGSRTAAFAYRAAGKYCWLCWGVGCGM
jgi:hypothetical protein